MAQPRVLSNRLQYDQTGGRDQRGALRLLNNQNNRNILSQQPDNGIRARDYTVSQILNRLRNYVKIERDDYENLEPSFGGWCRLLKRVGDHYEFRTGGFLIHNDPDEGFLTFRNAQKNFTFAMDYDEVIVFRHSNSGNLTVEVRAFITNLMSLELNTNYDFFVGLNVTNGQIYWVTNNGRRGSNLARLIQQQTGSARPPFTTDSIRNATRAGRNQVNDYILGFLNQESLDDLIVLRDNGRIVDADAEDRMRQFLESVL